MTFVADASANGVSFTEYGDIVTASASATATSTTSLENALQNAQEIASRIAEKQAVTSANIINQAENIILGRVNQYIEPSSTYSNSVAVGYGAQNNQPNQIQLGDANTSVVVGVPQQMQMQSVNGYSAVASTSTITSSNLPPIPGNAISTINGDQVVKGSSYVEGNLYAYQSTEIQNNLTVYGNTTTNNLSIYNNPIGSIYYDPTQNNIYNNTIIGAYSVVLVSTGAVSFNVISGCYSCSIPNLTNNYYNESSGSWKSLNGSAIVGFINGYETSASLFILMPGFGMIAYQGTNYTGSALISGINESSQPVSIRPAAPITPGSLKLYFHSNGSSSGSGVLIPGY